MQFLRLHLGLLAMLFTLFLESGASDEDDDEGEDEDDDDQEDEGKDSKGSKDSKGKKPKTYDERGVNRIVSARLNREREKIREEEAQKLKEAADKEQLEKDGKLQELLDAEREKATRLEREKEQTQAKLRTKAIKSALKEAASKLGFIDPDDATALISEDDVELDEDDEPVNAEELVEALVAKKPHLVAAEGDDDQEEASQRGVRASRKRKDGKEPRPVDSYIERTYQRKRAS